MNAVQLLDARVATAFFGRFSQLRPMQEKAIHEITGGQNIVLSASTGSGKTEAVVAPLVNQLWKTAIETDSLVIVYIAPTKALVNDLEKRLYNPLAQLRMRLGIRHGDRDDLSSGRKLHFLITTPESLDVMLFRKEPALRLVHAVIIDEVHLLYNTQRGLQLSVLLRRLKEFALRNLQWAALSATIGRIEDVRDFLFGPDENASFITEAAEREIDAQIRHVVSEDDFLHTIQKLMGDAPTKLLVFANSRRECERLAGILQRDINLRGRTLAHYSSLSTEVRIETEQKFSALDGAICIATSTLELGIDIGDIDAVLLWGVPASVESFLQRIGRGNRRQNKTNVVCLIPDTSTSSVADALEFMALLDAARKRELPIQAPFELFGAVGQQVLSVIASDNGRFTRIAELCKLFEHCAYLDRPVVEQVLAELADKDYLQRHGFKNQYGAGENLHTLVDYRMIYGNFGLGSQTIRIRHGSKVLGDIPTINLLRIQVGSSIRFAGRYWQVRKIANDHILAEPSTQRGKAVDFIYPGTGLGFDAFVMNRVWKILNEGEFGLSDFTRSLGAKIDQVIESFRRTCGSEQIPFLRTADGYCYFTFGGYLTNKAIALITKQVEFKATDLTLDTIVPVDWKSIPTDPKDFEAVFEQLFEMTGAQSIYQTLLPLELQKREFLQEWLKDDCIPKVLARLQSAKPVRLLQSFL